MSVDRVVLLLIRTCLLRRAAIAAENLALRRQLAVPQVSVKRPKLRKRDRVFWVWLSRLWSDWRSCLLIARPETVIINTHINPKRTVLRSMTNALRSPA